MDLMLSTHDTGYERPDGEELARPATQPCELCLEPVAA